MLYKHGIYYEKEELIKQNFNEFMNNISKSQH